MKFRYMNTYILNRWYDTIYSYRAWDQQTVQKNIENIESKLEESIRLEKRLLSQV